jgi:hypothetical protein
MRFVDANRRFIGYRLNILGIRVWPTECQLISHAAGKWTVLGARWDLPIEVPDTAESLRKAVGDPLRLTAWQYDNEFPGSDIRDVLAQRKSFTDALCDAERVSNR